MTFTNERPCFIAALASYTIKVHRPRGAAAGNKKHSSHVGLLHGIHAVRKVVVSCDKFARNLGRSSKDAAFSHRAQVSANSTSFCFLLFSVKVLTYKYLYMKASTSGRTWLIWLKIPASNDQRGDNQRLFTWRRPSITLPDPCLNRSNAPPRSSDSPPPTLPMSFVGIGNPSALELAGEPCDMPNPSSSRTPALRTVRRSPNAVVATLSSATPGAERTCCSPDCGRWDDSIAPNLTPSVSCPPLQGRSARGTHPSVSSALCAARGRRWRRPLFFNLRRSPPCRLPSCNTQLLLPSTAVWTADRTAAAAEQTPLLSFPFPNCTSLEFFSCSPVLQTLSWLLLFLLLLLLSRSDSVVVATAASHTNSRRAKQSSCACLAVPTEGRRSWRWGGDDTNTGTDADGVADTECRRICRLLSPPTAPDSFSLSVRSPKHPSLLVKFSWAPGSPRGPHVMLVSGVMVQPRWRTSEASEPPPSSSPSVSPCSPPSPALISRVLMSTATVLIDALLLPSRTKRPASSQMRRRCVGDMTAKPRSSFRATSALSWCTWRRSLRSASERQATGQRKRHRLAITQTGRRSLRTTCAMPPSGHGPAESRLSPTLAAAFRCRGRWCRGA